MNRQGYDEEPAWSPEGSTIAFTRYLPRVGTRDVYTVPPEGGTPVRRTSRISDDYSPTWSPDGRAIALTRVPFGSLDVLSSQTSSTEKNQIWTMNPDGGGLRRLTDVRSGASRPAWSPTGNMMSFDADNRLWVFEIGDDGSSGAPVKITPPPVSPFDASWLPGGRSLVVTAGADESHQLFVIAVAGQPSAIQIATGNGSAVDPAACG